MVEDVDELDLLGRGRVVDIMRDQDRAKARHSECAGVEALLEIRLVLHDGGSVRLRVWVVCGVSPRGHAGGEVYVCGDERGKDDKCRMQRARAWSFVVSCKVMKSERRAAARRSCAAGRVYLSLRCRRNPDTPVH